MTVEELFRQLSYWELSNLAVAVESTGTIKKEQRNKIICLANEALKHLHARFPLIESDLILPMTGEKLEQILPENALKVEAILNEWGESLLFNTVKVPGSIYICQRTIYVPIKELASSMRLSSQLQAVLQMRHPTLQSITQNSDLEQEITLLPELHAALRAHIAWGVYAGMNTADAAAAANNWRLQYESACNDALSLGLIHSEIRPLQKFEERGWV